MRRARVWLGSFQIWYWSCQECYDLWTQPDNGDRMIIKLGGTASTPAAAADDARLHLLMIHGWARTGVIG